MKLGLGKTSTADPSAYPGRRDAFHAPAVLVLCYKNAKPGDSVRFTNTFLNTVEPSERDNRHGVIDPFLKEIKPGDKVWVLLEPDLVGDMTHYFVISTDISPPDPQEYDLYDSYDSRRCRQEGC